MVVSNSGMGIAGALLPQGFYSDTMPSLVGRPMLEALNLFGLIFFAALALEWSWRMAWGLAEGPRALKDPSASMRWTLLLILIAVLMRLLPDTIQAMAWAESSPASRYAMALLDKRLDAASTIPFAASWALAYLGGPMIIYQLRREPLPLHLWPTWRQVSRPSKICLGCLSLALALTYLR